MRTWHIAVAVLVAIAGSVAFAANTPVIALNTTNWEEARQPTPFQIDAVHVKQLEVAMKQYGLKPDSLTPVGKLTSAFLPRMDGYFVAGNCYNANALRNDAIDFFPGYLQEFEGGWLVHFELGKGGNRITVFGESRMQRQGPPGQPGPPGIGIPGAPGGLGPAGPAGTPGLDGFTTLIKQTPEPPGFNCPNGGMRVDSGLDLNRNNILDACEIAATSYVCNGRDGQDGITKIVHVREYYVQAQGVNIQTPTTGMAAPGTIETNGQVFFGGGGFSYAPSRTTINLSATGGNAVATGGAGGAGGNAQNWNTLLAMQYQKQNQKATQTNNQNLTNEVPTNIGIEVGQSQAGN